MGCIQTSDCLVVLVKSVYDQTIGKFNVFPNPTINIITVNSLQNIQKIQVLNVTGKSVLTFTNSNMADLSGLATGLYHLALEFENGSMGHLKILKQ